MEEKKEIVITEECKVSIPKAGMFIQFDGEKCIIGLLHNTDLAIDGNFRIAATGNFEVVTEGHQIFSTTSVEKKVMLGTTESNYEKLQELENGIETGSE